MKRYGLVAAAVCAFVLCGALTVVHKYYMSLTEVHINTGKHTLDVSSKLFADDLETELEKSSGKKIDLASSAGKKEVEAVLFDYLNKNFRINVGGKLQTLTFVGFEMENDAVWCYLEVPNFKGKGTVSIYNSLLYDSFPEQSNLINVSWNDVSKSARLNSPDKMVDFVY
jgi:hypothetical protein